MTQPHDGPPRFPPGWYLAPDDPSLDRWWDGAAWTSDVRLRHDTAAPQSQMSGQWTAFGPNDNGPAPSNLPTTKSTSSSRTSPGGTALLALAIVLAVLAVIVNFQPVSLLSGTSTLYFGVVLAVIAVVLL